MSDLPRTRRRQRLLVIDDDPSVGVFARDLFAADPLEVITAETAAAGLALASDRRPDVVVLDHYLPDSNGTEVFQQLRQLDPRLPVIWLTARGTSETAIAATKLGAFDFLTKPADFERLHAKVHQALECRQLMLVPVEIAKEGISTADESDLLIGRCPAMQEVYKAIGRIAAHDVPTLLVGEPGTGKELVARALYQHGPRSGGPFHKVRCADLSPAQLEAILFGQSSALPCEGGSKLQQAQGGVLLLEELAAIEPALQSRLLRIIREGSDVGFLFTTEHDPEQLVRAGRLRSDLYYVLSAFTLRLPPLRERSEDLPLLVEHYIHRQANIQQSFGHGVVRVSQEALRLMQAYDWPGNVAELQAVLRRALIETKGTVLVSDFLRQALRSTQQEAQRPAGADAPANGASSRTDWSRFVAQRLAAGSTELYAEAIAETDRQLLVEVLAHTGGNQAQAARLLGITRTSLRKKVNALGIEIGRAPNAAQRA